MTAEELNYSCSDKVVLDHQKAAYREPQILLITGGTGSLGNAVVVHLLSQKHQWFDKIIIYSRDEQKQADMCLKFNQNPKLRFFIGDVRDRQRLRVAMQGVTHIIHAAAMKIVPSIEYNPQECIKTNIGGAENIIEICAGTSYPHKKVLALSTDKAVNPINLYGASKIASEKLFLDANNLVPKCKFSVARYGNVTNSRGSVIPLFKKLLDEGKPLTITDSSMTRFWITLEDAAKFVIDRLRDMSGDEIFIPEMSSYRVEDLAQILIENKVGQSVQYPSRVTGIRAGEKLHEDLVSKQEFEYIYDVDGYYVIRKQHNTEYAEILKEAHLAGLKISDTYNSSMFVMDRDTLKLKLLNAGLIEPWFEDMQKDVEITDTIVGLA